MRVNTIHKLYQTYILSLSLFFFFFLFSFSSLSLWDILNVRKLDNDKQTAVILDSVGHNYYARSSLISYDCKNLYWWLWVSVQCNRSAQGVLSHNYWFCCCCYFINCLIPTESGVILRGKADADESRYCKVSGVRYGKCFCYLFVSLDFPKGRWRRSQPGKADCGRVTLL